MPTLLRPCATARCQNRVPKGHCPEHQRGRSRARDAVRRSSHERGYGWGWQKFREHALPLVVARDGLDCRLCFSPVNFNRRGPDPEAPSLDHVVPKEHGGQDTLDNVQLAHFGCNARKRGRLNPGSPMSRTVPFPAHMRAKATIVSGPPGSGKTRYVEQHMQPGDLVLDVDAIFAALTAQPWYQADKALLPFATAARDAVLAQLEAPARVRHAWVLTTGSKGERARLQRRLDADVVTLAVPAEECLRRIAQDERRRGSTSDWRTLVHDWWRDHRLEEAVA